MGHRKERSSLLVIVLLAGVLICPAFSFAGEKINVILVTFDALGARYMPYGGFDKNLAPEMGKFSRESYLFTNAVSQAGTTSFSLGSIFSSRYPLTDRLMFQRVKIRKNKLFLPYILQRNNYNTYAIVRNNLAKSEIGFDYGFDYFDEDYIFSDAAETFQSAISLLKSKAGEPFFLWIHNEEPHSPYLPPEEYFRKYYRNKSVQTVYSFMKPSEGKIYEIFHDGYEKYHQDLFKISEAAGNYVLYGQSLDLSAEELKQLQARYFGNINYADTQFGRFMNYLKTQEFYGRTVVIVTADHGESIGNHGIFDHNDLYQDIIHVPLLVHLPGQTFGKVVNTQVELVDIYPTITEILGVTTDYEVRGESLFKEPRKKSTQFSEAPSMEGNKEVLIEGDIKYWCKGEKSGYYDLSRDPDELKMAPSDPIKIRPKCSPNPLAEDIFIDGIDGSETSEKSRDDGQFPPKTHLGKIINIDSERLNEFDVIFYHDRPPKNYYHSRRRDELLKLDVTENVTTESATEMIDRELFQIKTLFSNSFSPYPDEISNEIECPSRLKPRYYTSEENGETRKYLIAFSNDRYGMGVCSEDMIRFQYLTGWIYCPGSNELYKIRHYIPRGWDEKILHDFFLDLKCRKLAGQN